MNHEGPSNEQEIIGQLNGAFELHRSGRLSEAETAYRKLISILPCCWQLFYNLGLLLHETGRYPEAIEIFLTAASGGNGDGDLYFNLAWCCKQQGLIGDAISHYHRALDFKPDDEDTLYNLAGCYLAAGSLTKAAEIYRKILDRNELHASSLNNLAYIYHRSGDYQNAEMLYRRLLSIQPENEAALHMLAALTGENRVTAPTVYIRKVFDQYAEQFETSLTENLGYDLPQRLLNVILSESSIDKFPKMLDLGCGTGLIGEMFTPYSSHIVGVDISANMIKIATSKAVYATLYEEEISVFVTSCRETFDLVVAADVLNYIGDFAPLLADLKTCLNQHGRFYFSVEEHSGQEDLRLGLTGRFTHSDRYVRATAKRLGWTIVHSERIPLRKEQSSWVTGVIFGLKPMVLRK